MRIIDRYVTWTFLKNYLVSFMVLVGLYLVMDLVFNFDELVGVQDKEIPAGMATVLVVLQNAADYYFHQSFFIFVQLSGIIPVVAAAFTLMRLSRFNELTAMLAAGVPLLRIALPVILVSVALNVLLVIDQELVIPEMAPKLTRRHADLHRAVGKAFPIDAMQDQDGALLRASSYHGPLGDRPATMEVIDIIGRDAKQRPAWHISADRATWDAAGRLWRLEGGRITDGLLPEQRLSTDRPCDVYRGSITPEEIALYRRGAYAELLSTAHINELLQRPRSYGTADLLRVKHTRFTQPVVNVILVLLAIATVLVRDPTRVKGGIFRCLILVAACMASVFIAYQLAGYPPPDSRWRELWPALFAWAPAFLFGPVAAVLLERVRS